MELVFKKTLTLLSLLIRENHEVQEQIFHHLDRLLDVTIVQSELALALKEVGHFFFLWFILLKKRKVEEQGIEVLHI